MASVKIKVRKNGPLEVRGDIHIVDAAGNPISLPHEDVNFLCRCGKSEDKPFCDGTHNECEWRDGTKE